MSSNPLLTFPQMQMYSRYYPLRAELAQLVASSSGNHIGVNRLCIVVWADNNWYSWYVGYLTNETGRFIVDHTQRDINSSPMT